ncbi:MAG: nucleoside triphosphate pyrophosphohydrolase [Flavobacteriia bacterium]|nr:nucleoside triphosphate pyrophosphohydrolase [Flavobacteriia bacterium]
MDNRLIAFERLLHIMDELREKCPWDKKQTFETLRTLTIEETFELSDAIIKNDVDEIGKELGDLFLHLVFYSKIGEEKQIFSVEKVLNQICEKLIFRHPHIYGETKVKDEEEVKKNWEQLKLKEGKKSVLEGVPKSVPPLLKAFRIQEKVKGVGFEWDKIEDVWSKVEEEINELKEASKSKSFYDMELEFGDVFFSLVNVARYLKINPDDALERVNVKFIKRFQLMEELILRENLKINELELKELDEYWVKAKKIE